MALVSARADGSPPSLRVIDRTGQQHVQLPPLFHPVTEPTWTPDGGGIVFAAVESPTGRYALYTVQVP